MTELIALWLDFLYQQSLWAAILFPGILLAVYGFRKFYPGMLGVGVIARKRDRAILAKHNKAGSMIIFRPAGQCLVCNGS